jgi:regulator of extracellular matrix RemA (YlzA/DUF370 family)
MVMPEWKRLVAEAKQEIQEIDAAELKRMQDAKDRFELIDVREPDEVAKGSPARPPFPAECWNTRSTM